MLIVIRHSGPAAFGTVAARLRPAPPSLESSDGPVLLYDDLGDEIPDAADPRDVPVALLDVEGDQPGDEVGTHQFFKVLNPRPAMVKNISYASGVNEGYRKDELTVALLDARWNEEEWHNDRQRAHYGFAPGLRWQQFSVHVASSSRS